MTCILEKMFINIFVLLLIYILRWRIFECTFGICRVAGIWKDCAFWTGGKGGKREQRYIATAATNEVLLRIGPPTQCLEVFEGVRISLFFPPSIFSLAHVSPFPPNPRENPKGMFWKQRKFSHTCTILSYRLGFFIFFFLEFFWWRCECGIVSVVIIEGAKK